jgi:hypothetical protein
VNLAKLVGDAVDRVFREAPELSPFARRDARDGASLRRYYHATAYAEREVDVYRDKYWTKNGGRIFAELYCLIPEAQRVLGGVEQSWLSPDYAKPLIYFQYRTSLDANDARWEVNTPADVASFEAGLHAWLTSKGLAWLDALNSRDGLLDYLARNQSHVDLARLSAHWGSAGEARNHVVRYLNTLPRQNERALKLLTEAKLLSREDEAYLIKASLQSNEEYARRVRAWLESGLPGGVKA